MTLNGETILKQEQVVKWVLKSKNLYMLTLFLNFLYNLFSSFHGFFFLFVLFHFDDNLHFKFLIPFLPLLGRFIAVLKKKTPLMAKLSLQSLL